MISGEIEVNRFAQIRLLIEVKFAEQRFLNDIISLLRPEQIRLIINLKR